MVSLSYYPLASSPGASFAPLDRSFVESSWLFVSDMTDGSGYAPPIYLVHLKFCWSNVSSLDLNCQTTAWSLGSVSHWACPCTDAPLPTDSSLNISNRTCQADSMARWEIMATDRATPQTAWSWPNQMVWSCYSQTLTKSCSERSWKTSGVHCLPWHEPWRSSF